MNYENITNERPRATAFVVKNVEIRSISVSMNQYRAGRSRLKLLYLPARLLLSAALCHCFGTSPLGAESVPNLWRWSVAAVAAGQAADLATSHRGYESNSWLRNESGELATGRAIGIKGGATEGRALLQVWALRRWRNSNAARIFTVVLSGIAGQPGGVRVHVLRAWVPR